MTHWMTFAQYGYGGHMDGGWGWAMAAVMIAVVVGVVVLLIWLLSEIRGRPCEETAAQLLARRLASGEITPDEYRERAALLDERRPNS